MIKFIHKLTKSVMWVDESRKDEYTAAGHELAAVAVETKEPTKATRKTKKTSK